MRHDNNRLVNGPNIRQVLPQEVAEQALGNVPNIPRPFLNVGVGQLG